MTMEAFRGALIASDYLCRTRPPAGPLTAAVVARFGALRRDAATVLGPAAHPRTVTAAVARPLLRWLGWPAAEVAAMSARDCRMALVAGGTAPTMVVVVPAGAATRPDRRVIGDALGQGCRLLMVTDGRTLRIVDGVRGDPRGVLDVDLDRCVDDGTALAWLVALAGPAGFRIAGTDSVLDLARRSEVHGRRVCAALRGGVGEALGVITDAVTAAGGKSRGLPACFADARTAVYRVLFLLFAEARQLVPLWHPTYRRGYSIQALEARIAAGASARGTWAALQAIARLAHAGATSGDLRVVAFNGRLFSPARAPLLDHLALDDRNVARALEALCYTRSGPHGRARIAYGDLGVEELGSVYEGLLDREPREGSREPGAKGLQSRRKTTGTFYTPRPLADALVRETLAPLVEDRSPDDIIALRILDPAMGSGAFLVSAARFLEQAWERACERTASSPVEAERVAVRRHIAARCLFGVDRNPMAVQLAQLSMWLSTLAIDRPLSFLDHHFVAGNSLVGASPLDVLARVPGREAVTTPRPLEALFDWASALVTVRNRRARLESAADDTVSIVHEKEALLRQVGDDPALTRWKHACDLWCAAWIDRLPRGLYHTLLDRALGRPIQATPALREVECRMTATARGLACFHWPLEFPEVFLDENGAVRAEGGFDAVIGNPPWEMLRADAAREATARDEGAATVRFARASGLYRAQGRGHANQVQLFVERALQLTRPGGRVGLLVPATLLSDDGSAALRRSLILANGLESLTVYDNRHAIFPIHRGVRFATVVAARFGRTGAIRCRFGLTAPPGEQAPDPPDVTSLTPALIERLGGAGLAIPELPAQADVRLVERLVRAHPALGDSDGWHVRFGRELNATDDRDCFAERTARARGWPVVEGRHLSPYRVSLDRVTRVADPDRAASRLGGPGRVARARLAYRDVAAATNRTTLIAAIVPARTVTVHTVFCLRDRLPLPEQRVLCALLNSFVANYLVRRRVSTHVTTAIVEALAVPRVERHSRLFQRLHDAAETLESAADPRAAADAQAAAAEAFGLTDEEYAHVLASFPLVGEAERHAAAGRFSLRRPRQSCR
jgi:hypothetical protein